jgi:hypothetical protein
VFIRLGCAPGIALNANCSLPRGKDAWVGPVLMNKDGVEFAQQLHPAAGESGESGGTADLLRTTVVLDGRRREYLILLGHDLLDEIRLEATLDEDGAKWFGGIDEGGGTRVETFVSVAARHLELLF